MDQERLAAPRRWRNVASDFLAEGDNAVAFLALFGKWCQDRSGTPAVGQLHVDQDLAFVVDV